jgi:predicted transcriptional regulator of viral defense system
MNKLTEHFFMKSANIFTQAEVALTLDRSDFGRHGLIKRAMAGGEILNIRRGLYCLAPKYQKKPVSVYALAQRVYGPSYVSLETALSYHGWIPEAVYACTCVSYRSGSEFETPLGIFSYKRVPQRTFYLGVERHADENGHVFFMASPAKALADYLYIHRLKWRSIDEAVASLRIDVEDLSSVQPQELSELVENYSNSRIKRFLSGWMEALQS